MSMYNLLFGKNPFSAILLEMLGTSEAQIPRFRDCYLAETEIIIHTRTGGGNRDFYEHPDRCRVNYPEYFGKGEDPVGPWNADLRALPGFKYDEDDDFDCTYADFHYEIPEAFRPQIGLLRQMGAETEAPAEKWQKLLTALRAKEQTPEVERALKVGEKIIGIINDALKPEGSSS